jgi:hypothetical protein
VKLIGLKTKQELNGSLGLVLGFVSQSKRFSVEVDKGKGVFDLKPINLEPSKSPLSAEHGQSSKNLFQQQQQQASTSEDNQSEEALLRASELESKVSPDGLCSDCRTAQLKWGRVLVARRQKLSAMAVSSLYFI